MFILSSSIAAACGPSKEIKDKMNKHKPTGARL
jgi:hypothetical protein